MTQNNIRSNDLVTLGWDTLRFNTHQIREEMESYTIPKIAEKINRSGGVEEGKVVSRKIDPDNPGGIPTLYDLQDYEE